MINELNNKKSLKIITVVSVIIPLAVAVLIFLPGKQNFLGEWVRSLPFFNAIINTLTSILLVSALIAVKRGNIGWHKRFMMTAFILGAVFLVSYILYHLSVSSTKFGDLDKSGDLNEMELAAIDGIRYLYYFILLSHILLSIIVVPFVLLAFYYALTDKIEKHKKLVKFTFPIWLYVSVTGVITYWLISPYY